MKTILSFFSFLFMLAPFSLKASHLIVGEMTYKNTGVNTYEFTIYYYRDCLPPSQGGGNPSALADDDPAFITIFNGNSFYSVDSVFSSESIILPVNNTNGCLANVNPSCVNRLKFVLNKTLPPSTFPYTMLNQRCCMNGSISNINNPSNSGYSFYCKIPVSSIGVNSSAVFKPVTDVQLCIDKEYKIDHSAIDMDGDSLSYELCQTDLGGDPNNPKPKIMGGLPTILAATYISPYSATNPMGGLSINSETGELIIHSLVQGAFLVTICCHEWRGGLMINTIKRTYTYTIQNCDFSVLAMIACDSNTTQATNRLTCLANCNDKKIVFKNKSIGGLTYHWDFGVSSLSDDTSNVFEPSYTYPDTGRYKVTLLVYGATCKDSMTMYVNIYDDTLDANFLFTGNLCIGDSIQFTDLSTSANDNIIYWKWDFINESTYLKSAEQHPLLNFQEAGNYHVFLNAFNSHGCYATKETVLTLTSLHVVAYSDTIAPKGTTLNLMAIGAENYLWNYEWTESGNSGYLSNIQNPVVTENNEGEILYIVTGTNSNGCIGKDTIHIFYTNDKAVFVPNAFSPNGDHVNDVLKIFLSGYDLVYFKIYNRRGQRVYFSKDINDEWNGTFNGEKLGMDTYYWLACVQDAHVKEKIYKGDIILVR